MRTGTRGRIALAALLAGVLTFAGSPVAEAAARSATINGQSVSSPATAGWESVSSVTVSLTLAASANTVTVANPGDWAPDIDRITVG